MAIDRKMLVLLASAVLAVSSTASAQQWGSERPPRDGVCFYEDADFRGDYFCARTGDSVSRLSTDTNDRVSSIRIFGRAEVTVFRDYNYTGSSARIDYDVRDLGRESLNDLVSSYRVRSSSSSSSGHPSGGSQGNPDRVVRRAYQDILNREPDADGLRIYRSHLIDDGWTEAQVREALRKSAEYREKSTMTMEKAEDVVRRAYLAVLKREPDSGSRGYVNKVMRDHWTQGDVERELRNSPEYRNRAR